MKKPSIFKRIFTFLQDWYERFFLGLENEGKAGVVVTNWIREQVEKGNAEAVAYYSPTPGDDALESKGKQHALFLLNAYAKSNSLPVDGKSKLEMVKIVFNHLKSMKSKRAFWVEISGELIVFLADGRLDWNEAVILGQKIFWQFFSKTKKLAS